MKTWQRGGSLPMFVGGRVQRGYGRFRTQRGNGLGGILRKLFRSAVPFLIRGGREIGRQALKTGVNVGEDVLAGKKAKTAAQTRLKEAVGSITRKAINHAKEQQSTQIGGGRGIKRRARDKPTTSKRPRKANTPKRKRKKQEHNDIFRI